MKSSFFSISYRRRCILHASKLRGDVQGSTAEEMKAYCASIANIWLQINSRRRSTGPRILYKEYEWIIGGHASASARPFIFLPSFLSVWNKNIVLVVATEAHLRVQILFDIKCFLSQYYFKLLSSLHIFFL